MQMSKLIALVCLLLVLTFSATAQTPTSQAFSKEVNLADVRMRDVCILADEKTKTYYAVSSTMAYSVENGRRPALRVYTSKDLKTWEGPHIPTAAATFCPGDI